MDQFYAHVLDEEIEVAMPPTRAALPPYGDAGLMAIRGPGNVWLEFYDLAYD